LPGKKKNTLRQARGREGRGKPDYRGKKSTTPCLFGRAKKEQDTNKKHAPTPSPREKKQVHIIIPRQNDTGRGPTQRRPAAAPARCECYRCLQNLVVHREKNERETYPPPPPPTGWAEPTIHDTGADHEQAIFESYYELPNYQTRPHDQTPNTTLHASYFPSLLQLRAAFFAQHPNSADTTPTGRGSTLEYHQPRPPPVSSAGTRATVPPCPMRQLQPARVCGHDKTAPGENSPAVRSARTSRRTKRNRKPRASGQRQPPANHHPSP